MHTCHAKDELLGLQYTQEDTGALTTTGELVVKKKKESRDARIDQKIL